MKNAVFVAFFLLCGAILWAEIPAAVTGNYIEARSNEIYTCGCIFSGEQATSGREAILAWEFTAGDYNGTPLTGSRAVAVIVGESNLDFGTSRRSILYVDSARAGVEQAVLNLFGREYRDLLGEILAVRKAPIDFRMDNGTAAVRVAGVAVALKSARLPQDAHPGSILWYSPFVDMDQKNLATSQNYEFWGSDFRLQWRTAYPRITGYFGNFAIAR